MSDGLVVASWGLCWLMVAMSPVSATTVVWRFRDSRRFIGGLSCYWVVCMVRVGRKRFGWAVWSGADESDLAVISSVGGDSASVGREMFEQQIDRLRGIRHANGGGNLLRRLRVCGRAARTL